MRCLVLLASTLALLAFPAQAQERAMTDAEVLALADSQTVWCENWSDETRDCESLYMLRREADGALVQAGMFLLSSSPAIQFTIAEVVTLENGRLCSSGATDELNIRATLNGTPSPEMATIIRGMLAESMADYADSTICQQLITTGDPDAMGELITADDLRLYDFESTYRLGTVDSGFLLRGMLDGDLSEQETTDL